jgi:hypothetical protein
MRYLRRSDIYKQLGGKSLETKVDDFLLQQMLEKAPLLDMLENEYGIDFLRQSGSEWLASCPFPDHSDSSPSFFVNEEKNLFRCWGCSRAGTALHAIKYIEEITFPESLVRLSEISGIPLDVDFDIEGIRAVRMIEQSVGEFLSRKGETKLPGGLSESQFLFMIAERMRKYESSVDYDSEELEWVEKVYKVFDTHLANGNHAQAAKTWHSLSGVIIKRKNKLRRKQNEHTNTEPATCGS